MKKDLDDSKSFFVLVRLEDAFMFGMSVDDMQLSPGNIFYIFRGCHSSSPFKANPDEHNDHAPSTYNKQTIP
jgi:hypothetical protein